MTFSIAGLCPRTGEAGCALATSSMAAGARVPYVAPGLGVVLSQARTDPRLGPLGVGRLEAGRNADETLADMIAAASQSAWRQLAVVDQSGRTTHFTGASCIGHTGAVSGPGAIAIGNALANDRIPAAMFAAFVRQPDRPLAVRLISALEAGLAAGGEPYPLRSAALKIGRPGIPFPIVDLRVDFSTQPIAELSTYWENFAPLVEGYLKRALDPANAPPAAELEGHLRV
jgi:uncharacterized Ntn-hydrolase superfamily protein